MASIVDGFVYDIFISYRQNDNKYDGWVSEFVVNLRKELEATVKDKINIYFDENPYDGVLETHNVDKSLTDKLKSIIFLPILSQTYCDISSYAWQHEFLTFNRTRYRNQLNKVANSIKEILISIQSPGKLILNSLKEDLSAVSSDPKSIAVLPFVNMSNDPEQEYFSDGISEEIINTLVQIPGLKVAGRTSAFSFKNRKEDLRAVGEKLNVNTIITFPCLNK